MLAVRNAALGGAVMATGILSTALRDDGRHTASAVLLGLTLAAWLFLAVALGPQLRAQAGSPATLTAVAATAVLGTRLVQSGERWAGWVALAIAVALWIALVPPVLARGRRPVCGAEFLVVVATVSLAVLLAALGQTIVARVLTIAGLVAYAWILVGFDAREIGRGGGDQWVAGGALAIVALAGASVLRGADEVLYIAALAWVPLLIAGEVLRPRPRYDVRRWATVFPLAMYAAAGFADPAAWAHDFARIWVWVAVAAWLVVGAGLARTSATRRAPE